MKQTILTLQLIAFSISLTLAQYNARNLALEPVTSTKKYLYGNLQVYPIRANQTFVTEHRQVGQYMTLKEALEKKKVVITEKGSGRSDGEVNSLMIENISSEPVMILSGEVVQGGKQDRMIAQDVVINPKSGKKEIAVYCVEHGRWDAKKDGMAFKEYSQVSSNEVRKAGAVNKNQGDVWNKVAETNTKNNTNTSTGTLTALNNSSTFKTSIDQYKNYFQSKLVNEPDVIGLVAVSGDKVIGCDMFASHALFANHYPNLINSYSAEAITSGAKVSVSYDKVNQYVKTLLADEEKQEKELYKRGTMLKDQGKKVHISAF